LWQETHLQPDTDAEQNRRAAKHWQYSLRQRDFLQVHPGLAVGFGGGGSGGMKEDSICRHWDWRGAEEGGLEELEEEEEEEEEDVDEAEGAEDMM